MAAGHLTAGRGGGGTRRTKAHAKPLVEEPFLALARGLKRDLDAELTRLFSEQLDLAKGWGPEVTALLEAVRSLCLRGGKRLRPALVVTGLRAAGGGSKLEPAVLVGAALELLQAYLLIHDDWMDGDDTRRGGPAVHAALRRRFRSQRLGDAAGVLAGDYANALAQLALSELRLGPVTGGRVLACFARMQLHAIAGQQLDLTARKADPELVYALKTSSYSVAGPLELGALLADAKEPVLQALHRIARPIGVAFQLRDDLLNAFGEPSVTGKPRGSDLTAGKRTLLVTEAQRRARGDAKRALTRVLGAPGVAAAELQAALQVLDECGARRAVEERIDALAAEASAELTRAKLHPSGAALLGSACRALTQRHA